jgi:hypothetical protein
MSDEQQPVLDGDPTLTNDPEVDAEASAAAVDDGKGNKLVPLATLISAKKALKAATKAVKDLEPRLQHAQQVEERLNRAQPTIDAIITNPKLRAEALRLSQGTNATSETRATADPEDDPDASAIAEEFGFYRADGVTPDVERGRRVLSRLDTRHGKQTDDRLRPLAGITLNQKANENLRAAAQMTDEDGTPLATRESIAEVAKQLPPELLANPAVSDLVIKMAIGHDRLHKRTPKPVEEPLYLERQTGRRSVEPAISAQEKAQLERLGLTEADYKKSGQRLEQAVAGRRSIVLGS